MQNMLRPIVEAAGYLVIGENDELTADVTIVSQGTAVEPDEGGRRFCASQPIPMPPTARTAFTATTAPDC